MNPKKDIRPLPRLDTHRSDCSNENVSGMNNRRYRNKAPQTVSKYLPLALYQELVNPHIFLLYTGILIAFERWIKQRKKRSNYAKKGMWHRKHSSPG
ncbi:uncharacterized protein K441DRAFT_135541 [Cenococcum geophilum 1.58]|uniref:uncharacterized protein n=1 Tax=Cenococcum geophilum 1.58 TaxID=794803 RepID=UPI00358F1402|nr:hypothetical protein K441DRAFT_135541 [Cenococcum geophilum 1.58]